MLVLPNPPDSDHPHVALRRVYHHALRTHFPSYLRKVFHTLNPGQDYIHNWHLDAISEYLDALETENIRRLIINMPPRSLKSLTTTVAWTSYLLGRAPETKIITASYSSALSIKHAMDVRALVACPWYRQLFPQMQIMPGQNEKYKFATTRYGFRLATSVGGTLTGEGGDVIIVDDPLNPAQATSRHFRNRANHWFDHTLSSRLNDKRHGKMLVVMQRLHEEDLTGHLLGKGGWEQLCLPAIAESPLTISIGDYVYPMEAGDLLQPTRESEAILHQLRMDLGSMAFSAQYLQSPVSEQGHMIRKEWLHTGDTIPGTWDSIIQSWDTAIKSGHANDYSACVTIGVHEHQYYVLDVLAFRADYPELRRTVLSHYERTMPDAVLIEDKASGQSLLQDLRRDSPMPVIAILPKGDKVHRVARITPLLESGRILFPRHASWKEDTIAELLAFPHGAHDDRVDALTQAITWLHQKDGNNENIRVL